MYGVRLNSCFHGGCGRFHFPGGFCFNPVLGLQTAGYQFSFFWGQVLAEAQVAHTSAACTCPLTSRSSFLTALGPPPSLVNFDLQDDVGKGEDPPVEELETVLPTGTLSIYKPQIGRAQTHLVCFSSLTLAFRSTLSCILLFWRFLAEPSDPLLPGRE